MLIRRLSRGSRLDDDWARGAFATSALLERGCHRCISRSTARCAPQLWPQPRQPHRLRRRPAAAPGSGEWRETAVRAKPLPCVAVRRLITISIYSGYLLAPMMSARQFTARREACDTEAMTGTAGLHYVRRFRIRRGRAADRQPAFPPLALDDGQAAGHFDEIAYARFSAG